MIEELLEKYNYYRTGRGRQTDRKTMKSDDVLATISTRKSKRLNKGKLNTGRLRETILVAKIRKYSF